MKPLLIGIVHALWYDEMAARRWLRGLAGFLSALAVQVAAAGMEAMQSWTPKQWAMHVGLSLFGLIHGLISVGEKNKEQP